MSKKHAILKPAHKAVFFDAGGTLLEPFPSVGDVYSRYAKKFGLTANPKHLDWLFHQVWHSRNASREVEKGIGSDAEKLWWKELVREVFQPLGGVSDFDRFFDELYFAFASRETWKIFDEVLDVLRELKARGVFLGIISNWDSRLVGICKDLGLDQYFHSLFVSALVGFAKPDPRIFTRALDEAGVLPEEAIHVGDSLEDDYFGARSAGLEAVFLDRHDRNSHLNILRVQNLREIL